MQRINGADIELGNFLLGVRCRGGSGDIASKLLLRCLDGTPACSFASGTAAIDPQDIGRKYLPENGGSVYIDLEKLEVCIPEVVSAYDHVAAVHAMLRKVQAAMRRAAPLLPEGVVLQVTANNSDGQSHSWGAHLNFLVRRRTWENLLHRKTHLLGVLVAHQVSSIVYTGAGKVGSENGRSWVPYQISQRADFFQTLTGVQTTFNRPLVNSRDESLCGASREHARLHCIFYDSNLCHVPMLLKVGTMQIILTMIEAEALSLDMLLDDPLAALVDFSHDPGLRKCARTVSGKWLTAVELQMALLDQARSFAAVGALEGVVPRASEILALWEDTLFKLAARDFDALTGRLDWVLRRRLLERAMRERGGIVWDSPIARILDQAYASLSPDSGLFWECMEAGIVERVVDDQCIDAFCVGPPTDTRAWTRAMLLRAAGCERVESVDWDRLAIRSRRSGRVRDIRLSNPEGCTRAAMLAAGACEDDTDLAGLLRAASVCGAEISLRPSPRYLPPGDRNLN